MFFSDKTFQSRCFFEDNLENDKDSCRYYEVLKKIWDKILCQDKLNKIIFNEKDSLDFLLEEAKLLIHKCIIDKINDSKEFPDYSSVYPFNLIICWQRIKHGSKWKDGQDLVKDYFDKYISSEQVPGSERYYDILKKHYDTEKEYYRGVVFA